jgi:hypothetical protein
MSTQLSLFNEPTQQSTATASVLVRSHLRHVKGGKPTAPRSHTAPHNGQATSHAAADSLSSGHLQAQEARVLAALRSVGSAGLIREQIAAMTGIEITDVCRVINGLARATKGAEKANRPKLVEDGPQTRRSSHGRSQKVVRAL